MTAAQRHQQAQEGLARLLAKDLVPAWQILKLQDLQGSLPAFCAAVYALIARYAPASASLAADFYEAQRLAAGARGIYRVALAPVPPPDQIRAGVTFATSGLWTADLTDAVISVAQRQVAGIAQKAVADVGRDTIRVASTNDPHARGWARVVEGNACDFCEMLGGRGDVYTEESSQFASHNHCNCSAEPVFH